MKRMNIPLSRDNCERQSGDKSALIVYILACLLGLGLGLIYLGILNHFATG